MTKAIITKIIKDRGFGFATDESGQLYFFHYSALDPKSKINFDNLEVGNKVTFISMDAEKGPRAKPRTLNLEAASV